MAEKPKADPARTDAAGLLEAARCGDRSSVEAFLTLLIEGSTNGGEQIQSTPASVSGSSTTQSKQAIRELIAYLPRVEARDLGVLLRYWTAATRNLLGTESERLRAKRREVLANRPLGQDAAVLIDPPQTAVTSVSRLNAKSDEYSRLRAVLPILDPVDEEVFVRVKLLGEPPEQIGTDFGKPSDWGVKRSARAYQRLFALIGKVREGKIDEVLRAGAAAAEGAHANPTIPRAGSTTNHRDGDSGSGTPIPILTRT